MKTRIPLKSFFGASSLVLLAGAWSSSFAAPVPSPVSPIIFGVEDSSRLNNPSSYRTGANYRAGDTLGTKICSIVTNAEYTSRSRDAGSTAKFESDTFAVGVGLEVNVLQWLRVGITGNYISTDSTVSNLGTHDLNSLGASIYATAEINAFHASLTYSRARFDDYPLYANSPGLGSQVLAQSENLSQHLEFHAGFDMPFGAIKTGPVVGIRYATASLDGYSGKDSTGTALRAADQSFSSTIPKLGWQGTLDIPVGGGGARFSPHVHIFWEKELSGDDRTGAPTAALDGAGTRSLSYPASAHEDDSWFALGLGVELAGQSNWTVSVGYDTYLALDGPDESFWALNGSLAF